MPVIDMQTMRYINLLDRDSKVKTSKCFVYNNTIIFAVPRNLVSRAIGPAASNIRSLQEKIGKRIKVIREAEGLKDAERFISEIVSPIRFKSIDIRNEEKMMIINAGSIQNKAALFGRNKIRFEELKQITHDYFGLDLKIV